MTQLPKIEYLRQYFVYEFQDDKGRNCVLFTFWNFGQNVFLKFHFRLPSHENHYHNCIWYSYHSDICLDYPKIISEKWNLAVKIPTAKEQK